MVAISGPYDEAVKTVPEIIKQASSSPLGILALMLIILGILAYVFLKNAPVSVRVPIFIAMLAGVVLYGVAITRAHSGPSDGVPPGETQMTVDGTVVDAGDNSPIPQAEIRATGSAAPVASNSDGSFHIQISSALSGHLVNLRVSKDGYAPITWQITPPVPLGVTVPLSKSKPH